MTTNQNPGSPVAEHPPVARTGSWLSVLVAILTQLLLLDAAVETFLSGSALRWWIVLPALAWVALCVFVLVRRGTDADGAARGQIASALSFIGLLLLLALPAWLPG
jgi:hypothetical protein